MKDLETLATELIVSRGATLDMDTLTTPRGGVAVGRPGQGLILERPDRASVRAWLQDMDDRVSTVGTWTDPATGLIYLDVVDIVDDVLDALHLAALRDELAVFDLGTMTEYMLAA